MSTASDLTDRSLDIRYDAFVDVLKSIQLYPSTIAKALNEAYGLNVEAIETSIRKALPSQAQREYEDLAAKSCLQDF